jgi:transcriptional regulator with XRE-family HTH domain
MKQKELNSAEVERNSNNAIDQSHVSKFMRGVEKNPSASTIVALAAGLGVNPHEVFTAVTGYLPDSQSKTDGMELIIPTCRRK